MLSAGLSCDTAGETTKIVIIAASVSIKIAKFFLFILFSSSV
jgi:hypothetical protein